MVRRVSAPRRAQLFAPAAGSSAPRSFKVISRMVGMASSPAGARSGIRADSTISSRVAGAAPGDVPYGWRARGPSRDPVEPAIEGRDRAQADEGEVRPARLARERFEAASPGAMG